MSHRVAVVIRTKDRSYFLRRALADIADQSFTDAEIVVVNDGGDPQEVRTTVAASRVADRARVVHTSESGGRCAAANAGVRASEAPYVVLHDDDDRWHPDFLATTVAALDAAPEEAGVMVRTEIVIESQIGGEWVEEQRMPFWERMSAVSLTSLLEINRAVPISFLYRRSIHEEVGYYDESLDTVEDWDLYLRIAARHPIGFLGDRTLAYWTHRPKATGSDGNSMFELADQHLRDDGTVRDRALRDWVSRNGLGIPLQIGLIQKDLRETSERLERHIDRRMEEQTKHILRHLDELHPFAARFLNMRRRVQGDRRRLGRR